MYHTFPDIPDHFQHLMHLTEAKSSQVNTLPNPNARLRKSNGNSGKKYKLTSDNMTDYKPEEVKNEEDLDFPEVGLEHKIKQEVDYDPDYPETNVVTPKKKKSGQKRKTKKPRKRKLDVNNVDGVGGKDSNGKRRKCKNPEKKIVESDGEMQDKNGEDEDYDIKKESFFSTENENENEDDDDNDNENDDNDMFWQNFENGGGSKEETPEQRARRLEKRRERRKFGRKIPARWTMNDVEAGVDQELMSYLASFDKTRKRSHKKQPQFGCHLCFNENGAPLSVGQYPHLLHHLHQSHKIAYKVLIFIFLNKAMAKKMVLFLLSVKHVIYFNLFSAGEIGDFHIYL